VLSVAEYATSTLRLEEDEVSHLAGYVRSSGESGPTVLHGLTPTNQRGVYRVTAGGYVGRLGLPSGRVLDLTSRFRFKRLVWLLSLANRFPIQPDALTAAADVAREPIAEVAHAFTREVRRLIGQGLAKGYEMRRFVEPPYPGRLDAAFHLGRMGGRPDKLATTAKRLTADTLVNQALAAALDVLRRNPVVPPHVASAVENLVPALRYITRSGLAARDLGRITLDRLTARYRPALGLAELILRAESYSPLSGRQAGSSLVYNMPAVWEGFVAHWIREHCDSSLQVRAQYGFPVTTDGAITATADVIVEQQGRPTALYDAKYKWPSSTPSTGDLFQMIAYCERLGLTEATLVYPVDAPLKTVAVGTRRVHSIGVAPTPCNLSQQTPPCIDGSRRRPSEP
jgi:5-methylcytosine-specific restriction endonuclease McrBC regulatory subunit McrC